MVVGCEKRGVRGRIRRFQFITHFQYGILSTRSHMYLSHLMQGFVIVHSRKATLWIIQQVESQSTYHSTY